MLLLVCLPGMVLLLLGQEARELTEPVPSRFVTAGASPLIFTLRYMLVNRDPATSIRSVSLLMVCTTALSLLLLL